MSFLAWNCHGLGNPRTVRFLKEIVQQIRPIFIFLPEILTKNKKVEEICKVLQFAGCWVVDA